MANNPDGWKESYHEVPAHKYLFLYNTAIHKRFFKWWTLTLIIATYVGTRLAADVWLLTLAAANMVPVGMGAGAFIVMLLLYHRLTHHPKRSKEVTA